MNDDDPENEEYWYDNYESEENQNIPRKCPFCHLLFYNTNSYAEHLDYEINFHEKYDEPLTKHSSNYSRPTSATPKQITFLRKSKFWPFESDPFTKKIAWNFINLIVQGYFPTDSQLRKLKELGFNGEVVTQTECLKEIYSRLDPPDEMLDELKHLGFKHNRWGENGPVKLNRWDAWEELQKIKKPTKNQLNALKRLKIDNLDIKTQFVASEMISLINNIKYHAVILQQKNYKQN